MELVLAQEGRQDNIVRSAKVLESDRIGLDLTASENTRETHHQAMSKQMDIEFTDEPGFVDPRDLARRRFQSGFQRAEPNPSRHENLIELNYLTVSVEIDGTQMRNPSGIDFSKSMTQMLESLKDNWSTTMKTLLTDQEERVGRLEQGFAAVSSSNLRIESQSHKIQAEYQRLNSVIQKTEDVLPGLCSEVQANFLNL